MRIPTLFKALLCSTVLAVLVTAAAPVQAGSAKRAIKRIDNKHVCMLMDQAYDQDQTPVAIGGHTYYAMCEMCAGSLKGKPEARSATDPVTGKKIDKASAVIGVTPEGTLVYFENENSFKHYEAGEPIKPKK